MTNKKSTLQERLRDEWLAGFWAASLLLSGRYDDYAVQRDKMLALTEHEPAL